MSDPFKQTIQIYNQLGRKYIKDTFKSFPVERSQFIKLTPKGAKILDVGSAGGRDAKEFVRKGFDTTGIDISPVFIKEAKKLVPKAKFIKMDVRKITFPKNSFDAIWANAVLLHVDKKDLPIILKKFFQMLKPGGVLHVGVKLGRSKKVIKERLSGGQSRLFTLFQKEELKSMFKDAKFKVIYSAISKDELKRKDVKWVTVWGKK